MEYLKIPGDMRSIVDQNKLFLRECTDLLSGGNLLPTGHMEFSFNFDLSLLSLSFPQFSSLSLHFLHFPHFVIVYSMFLWNIQEAWIDQWYSAGLRAGWSGFESRQGLRILLFTTAFRPTLEPIQPPIQWVLGALPLEIKREANHSAPSSTEVKEWVELHIYSPNTPSWRRAQLKKAQGKFYFFLYHVKQSHVLE
jgi:hypothetical protein